RATREADSRTGRGVATEGPGMLRLERELHDHDTGAERRAADPMAIAGKGGDERPDKLIATGCFALDEGARKLNHDIVRVVRENAVFVAAGKCVVVIAEKGCDVGSGPG